MLLGNVSETIGKMTQFLHDSLVELYADDGDTCYEQVMQLVAKYQIRLQDRPTGKGNIDETDVVLITYGDSLLGDGQPPLESLHTFARNTLNNIISHIHILPCFPYSSDDGFSVQDFYSINPTLGKWSHIRALSQDFDLMFDAVLNHMSAQSEWFKGFLADDPQYAGLFRTESPETDLSSIVRPRQHPLLTPFTKDNGEQVHVWTTFSADQVDFDLRHPSSLLRLLDILLFYVAQGASYIRLDAIGFLWKEVGTTSIHLPQTHSIIQMMRAILDLVAPDVQLITETNVPHAENVSYFGDGTNEAQMVYNFTLPPLLFHSILSGNTTKLRQWINTLTTPSSRTTFFNFTASHDGIGVRPVEGILDATEVQAMIDHVEANGGRVSYKQNGDGSHSPYELNITYVDAMIDPQQSQEWQIARFILSQMIAMSLAGVPAVYIHSILGSRNDLAGMQESGRNRSINRAKLHLEQVQTELTAPHLFRSQIFAQYRQLLQIRTQQGAFHPNAKQQAVDLENDALLGVLRDNEKTNARILAVFNLSDQIHAVDVSHWLGNAVTDLVTTTKQSNYIQIEPYQGMWLVES